MTESSETERLRKQVEELQQQVNTLQTGRAASYQTVKKVVLIAVLGLLFFMFGYLFLGNLFGSGSEVQAQPPESSAPAQTNGSQGGPPAPVMQQIQSLKERIAKNPMDGDAYSQLGDLYFQANMYDKARELYQKAVQINGNDVASRNDLAICDHLVGKNKEAFDELNTALKIAPKEQHLWLTLGVIAYETGDLRKARESLENAYQIDPKSDAGTKAQSMLAALTKGKR